MRPAAPPCVREEYRSTVCGEESFMRPVAPPCVRLCVFTSRGWVRCNCESARDRPESGEARPKRCFCPGEARPKSHLPCGGQAEKPLSLPQAG